jgi:hypothetical protein
MVVAGLAALGCTSDTGSASARSSDQLSKPAPAEASRSAPPNQTVAKCAVTVPPSVPTRQRDGTASAIVPGEPISLLGCRYHGFNQPEPFGSLANSAQLDHVAIDAQLNQVPIPPPGAPIPNCPDDFGEKYVLWFGYPDASTLLVTVGGAGCAYADNGNLQVPFANTSLTSLQQALGHDSQ